MGVEEYPLVVKNIYDKLISENMRDTVWLISVGHLPVRAVVQWSCYVTTKECPMSRCVEDETLEHLLLSCYRTVEIRQQMTKMGFEIDNNIQAIKYGLFKEKMYDSKRRLFWLIMCVINTHIWKTRAKVVIEQKMIDSVAVCKNILTDLRRRKTLEQNKNSPLPWDLLKI